MVSWSLEYSIIDDIQLLCHKVEEGGYNQYAMSPLNMPNLLSVAFQAPSSLVRKWIDELACTVQYYRYFVRQYYLLIVIIVTYHYRSTCSVFRTSKVCGKVKRYEDQQQFIVVQMWTWSRALFEVWKVIFSFLINKGFSSFTL